MAAAEPSGVCPHFDNWELCMENEAMRVRELERDIRRIEVANASLATSVNHLSTSVIALTETVSVLRDTMNQGRGAMWLLMGAAGALGAVVATFVKHLIGTKV